MFNIHKIFIFASIALLFLGCEESNYTVTTPLANTTSLQTINTSSTRTFSGILVDGYIKNATICFDTNMDGLCTQGEQTTTTNKNGAYTLNLLDDNVTLVQIIASDGEDTSTDKVFHDTFKTVLNYNNINEGDNIIVSPITDLIAQCFENSSNKNLADLLDAKSVLSSLLGLTIDQLDEDPMLNIDIFALSQEIQHTKLLLETIIEKNLPNFDLTIAQEEIKKQMIELNLNVSNILDTLEVRLHFTIPDNEKNFIIAQANELKKTLNTLAKDTSLDIDNLNRLQKSLDLQQQEAYKLILNYDTNTTLNIIDLNITNESITQTIFNTTNAQYDENGCTTNNAYNTLEGIPSITYNKDLKNRIGIKSEDSTVTLYYPKISTSTLYEPINQIVVYEDNYNILYDAAWTTATEQTIYVKTAQDTQGLHSCYRYELNSIHESDIIPTKVFSYSTLN